MSIADEVTKVEKENRDLKVKLAMAEGTIENYKQELVQERKTVSTLTKQVDDHNRDPLQDQVKKLGAELKEANANARIKKLKGRVQKLEEKLAAEQSLRMKSENHPKVKQENEELQAEVERLKSSNDTHHKCRTKADQEADEAKKGMADTVKLAEVYERELERLEVDHIQLVKSAGLKL